MKTLKLLTIIFFIGLLSTSCKKDYTCDCTIITSGFGQATANQSSTSFSNLNRRDAKAEEKNCNSRTGTTTISIVTVNSICAWKTL